MKKISPPLTTVDATLKYHRPHFTNETGALVMAEAFPYFIDLGPTETQLRGADEMTQRGNVDAIYLMPQRRRFAGVMESLPRGRYYSVCLDEHGNDNGTLVAELSAYRARNCPGVEVFDLHMPDQYDLVEAACEAIDEGVQVSGFVVNLEPHQSAPNPITRKLVERGLIARSGLDLTVSVVVPVVIEHKRIEKVFDLRQLETQRWLVEFLPPGDDVFRMPMADKCTSFTEMLPSFMNPELGGEEFTVAFGSWLQTVGANGLVFPSARTDIYCSFKYGKLAHFSGWNFVDYRSDKAHFKKDTLPVYLGKWSPGFLKDGNVQIVVASPDDRENLGSWRIEGNLAAQIAQPGRKLEASVTFNRFGEFLDAVCAVATDVGLDLQLVRRRIDWWLDDQSLGIYLEKCQSGAGCTENDVLDFLRLLRWSIETSFREPDFKRLEREHASGKSDKLDHGEIREYGPPHNGFIKRDPVNPGDRGRYFEVMCIRCSWTDDSYPCDHFPPTACPECGMRVHE